MNDLTAAAWSQNVVFCWPRVRRIRGGSAAAWLASDRVRQRHHLCPRTCRRSSRVAASDWSVTTNSRIARKTAQYWPVCRSARWNRRALVSVSLCQLVTWLSPAGGQLACSTASRRIAGDVTRRRHVACDAATSRLADAGLRRDQLTSPVGRLDEVVSAATTRQSGMTIGVAGSRRSSWPGYGDWPVASVTTITRRRR